jgi:putative DNA primase/helicase
VRAADIVTALGGRGKMAKCPAHADEKPSLSVTERHGRLLVHCHAGCAQDAVIEALKALKLWSETEERTAPRLVAEYDYTDEAGELLYQVVRFEPKDFRPRYRDRVGNWVWRKHPRQVLYRLREVLESPIVFVVEGERDVETLRAHGFVATTNAGGARAPWLHQYTTTLSGREVVIIPDNDRPGWQRAATIARALFSVAEIGVLELPSEHKDVTDWFSGGHSESELIAMVEGTHVA